MGVSGQDHRSCSAMGSLIEILSHASDHGSHIDGLLLIRSTKLSVWAAKR